MVGSGLGLTLSMPTWSPSAAHPSPVILDLDSTTNAHHSYLPSLHFSLERRTGEVAGGGSHPAGSSTVPRPEGRAASAAPASRSVSPPACAILDLPSSRDSLLSSSVGGGDGCGGPGVRVLRPQAARQRPGASFPIGVSGAWPRWLLVPRPRPPGGRPTASSRARRRLPLPLSSCLGD